MAKILRFWHRWRDIIQVGGFLVMMGSISCGLWQGFVFIQQANANTIAIGDLQLWKEQTAIGLARMEQKIDDIKDAVVEK